MLTENLRLPPKQTLFHIKIAVRFVWAYRFPYKADKLRLSRFVKRILYGCVTKNAAVKANADRDFYKEGAFHQPLLSKRFLFLVRYYFKIFDSYSNVNFIHK